MTPPGLAVERTVLAWTRTWLSAGGCGLLLLRLSAGSPVRLAVSLGAGGLAIAVLTAAGRRRGRLLRAGDLPVAVRAAAVTAGTVTALGAVAAALLVSRW